MGSKRLIYTPQKWIEAYANAWREKNLKQAADLWTEEVKYSFDPFRCPIVGRDDVLLYWEQALMDQTDIELHVRLWLAMQNEAAGEWWVSFNLEGQYITLSASLLLRFASDGRCSELHEHWLKHQGHISPPDRFAL